MRGKNENFLSDAKKDGTKKHCAQCYMPLFRLFVNRFRGRKDAFIYAETLRLKIYLLRTAGFMTDTALSGLLNRGRSGSWKRRSDAERLAFDA